MRNGRFDAAILDVMLPEMDGFALSRTIRQDSDIPIIMLTARGELTDRVVGLELGADDYLPKPFEPRELVARIQTILRRQRVKGNGKRMHFEGLEIDLDTHNVLRQGEVIELTSTEFALLVLLAREPGKVVSRDDILNHLRGHETEIYTTRRRHPRQPSAQEARSARLHQDPAQRRLRAGARPCLSRPTVAGTGAPIRRCAIPCG